MQPLGSLASHLRARLILACNNILSGFSLAPSYVYGQRGPKTLGPL
jgi:hypothetical protein